MNIPQANDSQSNCIATVTHDLKNPLAFIMLQTKLLERQLTSNSISHELLIEKMKKINESCHKMNHVIQNLLEEKPAQ